MINVLKMSRAGFLDPFMAKNFVQFMSLFPIGSLVRLSNKKIAKVVEASPSQMEKPIVSVLTDENAKLLEQGDVHQVDLSRQEKLTIVTALDDQLEGLQAMDGM